MKKSLFFVFLILALVFTSVSCSKGGNTDATSEPENTTAEAAGINTVGVSQKLEWKPFLTEQIKKCLSSDEGLLATPIGFGIIDVDMDAMPELAVAYLGGTAGNIFFQLIDVKTGEERGSFDIGTRAGGKLGSLAIYLDTETKSYMYAGESNYRGGWQMMTRNVMTFKTEDGKEYNEYCLFCEVYEYPSNMGNDTPAASKVECYVNGELVLHENYFAEYEAFWEKLVKIENSDFVYFKVTEFNDTTGAEAKAESIADALINSTQVFVKGGEIK